MKKFATPYKYAKLCGLSSQAIYKRIKAGTLTVKTIKDQLTGEDKQVIDLAKFPPTKKTQ